MLTVVHRHSDVTCDIPGKGGASLWFYSDAPPLMPLYLSTCFIFNLNGEYGRVSEDLARSIIDGLGDGGRLDRTETSADDGCDFVLHGVRGTPSAVLRAAESRCGVKPSWRVRTHKMGDYHILEAA